MNKQLIFTLAFALLSAGFTLSPPIVSGGSLTSPYLLLKAGPDDPLREAAFRILDSTCNGCHRKRKPLMVFKRKNMERRAAKIYRAVFRERSMPKGDKARLSRKAYATLEKCLLTQNLD